MRTSSKLVFPWVAVPMAVFLLLLTACGGGSSAPQQNQPACTILGFGGPLAFSAPVDVQVTVEVRFLSVTDDFFEQIGVDFDVVVEPEADPNPDFGGAFESRPGYATPNGVVAGLDGADTIIPQGHHPGSMLPIGTVGLVPGVGDAWVFVRAPGDSDQCLDVDALLRFPLQDDSGLPSPTAIVPEGGITSGFGLALEFLNDTLAQTAIDLAENDAQSEVITAPLVTLFDGQRAMVQSVTRQVPATDLLDDVQNVVLGGKSLQDAFTGITLDLQPTITLDKGSVLLKIRVGAHGTFVSLPSQLIADGNPVDVFVPALKPTMQTTQVTVPDGGTILIGGIKELKDDSVPGVPLVSKIPYLNRLFKNQSAASSSESLMLMVTPRIIILDEEQ